MIDNLIEKIGIEIVSYGYNEGSEGFHYAMGKVLTILEEEKNRPPLGLKPKFIHDEQRIKEISEAITRYTQANYLIPKEWIEEYNKLVEGLK